MRSIHLAAALCLASLPSLADQIVWTATGPGLFNDPGNWTSLGGAGNVVPGGGDFVSYISSRAPSPAGTLVPNTFGFGIRNLFISGLNTTFLLKGTSNFIGTDLFVEGAPGGNDPVVLAITGSGSVNVNSVARIGTEGGVTSVLGVTGGAVFTAGTLSVGGFDTKGAVGVTGGSITAGNVEIGWVSPQGGLSIEGGSVTANGANGITVGNFSGTGGITVKPNGFLHLTNGALTLGSGGGTGGLSALGDTVLSGFFFENRFATINAEARNVVVGAPTSTGNLSLGGNSTLNTTGTVTVGTGGSSKGTATLVGGFGNLGPQFATLNSGNIVIGDANGNGTLGMQSFSSVTGTELIVGRLGGTGVVNANGALTAITLTNGASIGIDGGNGTVVIGATSGAAAVLNAGGIIAVGDGAAGSVGKLAITGSATSTGMLVGIFNNNQGVVQVSESGSLVATGSSFFGTFGGQGTLLLKDNGIFYTTETGLSSAAFGLFGGTGTLAISEHATLLSLGTVTLGSSGTGLASVRSNGLLSAFDLRLGDGGTGSLVLEGGGLIGGPNNLASSDIVTIGRNGGSGSLRAFDAARADINNLNIAIDKGSTGVLSVESDTSFKVSGALLVGSDVSGGGTASIAVDHASFGAGTATIGRGGDLALFQIKFAGSFSSTADVSIGSNGIMIVTDPSSLAFVGGTLTVGGPLAAVPVANANLVVVQNGAELDAKNGLVVGSGNTGTLVADGTGTLVDVFAATTIGGSGGTGTVVLKNKAKLQSKNPVTVKKGGTLIGSGSVVGSVVNAGGIVVPGGSPGALEVTGDFTQETDSLLKFEIFGPEPSVYDQLFIGGNADVGGTIEITFLYAPLFGAIFNLITVGGTADFSKLEGITVIGLDSPIFAEYNNGVFSVQVVPEPGTIMLMTAASLVMLLVWRRRSQLTRPRG